MNRKLVSACSSRGPVRLHPELRFYLPSSCLTRDFANCLLLTRRSSSITWLSGEASELTMSVGNEKKKKLLFVGRVHDYVSAVFSKISFRYCTGVSHLVNFSGIVNTKCNVSNSSRKCCSVLRDGNSYRHL